MVVYLYCTKGNNKPCIVEVQKGIERDVSGTVFAVFAVGKVEKITDDNVSKFTKQSCLTKEELINYLGRVDSKGVYTLKGYAIHVKDLRSLPYGAKIEELGNIKRPPQNMQCIGEEEIMISLKPKYCKLLMQGQKTIEIRRTVLKELEEIAEWIF